MGLSLIVLHCLHLLIPSLFPSLQEAMPAASDAAEVGDGGRKADPDGDEWVNFVVGSYLGC